MLCKRMSFSSSVKFRSCERSIAPLMRPNLILIGADDSRISNRSVWRFCLRRVLTVAFSCLFVIV